MLKQTKSEKKATRKKERFSFPTLGRSVLASSLKEAQKMVGIGVKGKEEKKTEV